MDVGKNTLAAKLIAASDLRAERLISVLRMILAAMLFAGVSFVLSQTESAGLLSRKFELLSLLAGAVCYFTLGAVNFYFATKERLKPWMSWVFNVIEVILVAVQLLIDVIDPNTPSLLAFASPVILVAVLVICVQALRYKIELHIFSSLFLLGLCVLILFHDPQIGQQLTPQAAHELQLLYTVPPTVMRFVMLTAVALLIGMAVYRSKRLIEAVALETEIAENRKRFLPQEISELMNDDNLNELRQGEDRDLAALVVDIRGFTRISEDIGPRETAKLLSAFRTLVTDAVSSHGGVVDKFIGDGALIVFGLHCDLKEACINATKAANEIVGAVEDWNKRGAHTDLNIVVAIHAGPTVIGAIGDDRRLEFTAIGDTINMASRLEEIAKENDWTQAISKPVAETAGLNMDEYTSLQTVVVRGSSQPLEVYGKT